MGTEGMRERSLELRKKDRLRLVFLHRTVQSSWKREEGRSMTNLIVAIFPIRCVLGILFG